MRHFFDKVFLFCFAVSRFSSVLTGIPVVPEVNGSNTWVWGEGIRDWRYFIFIYFISILLEVFYDTES